MSFNPASYAVAGFVDVTNMSRQDRKRIGQNDDEGYGTPEARLGTLAHAAIEAQFAARTVTVVGRTFPLPVFVQALEQSAARFALRRDNFAAGKDATCLDIAAKLDRFGSFVSDKQAEFAYKLIGWSAGYGQPHPMEAPAKAPASPVAASNAIESHYPLANAPTARLELPKLFALMQRLSKLEIGKLKLVRKNQDSLVWIKIVGVDGVVGKIEAGFVSIFTARLDVKVHGIDAATIQAELVKIEADPEAAAALHGKLSGRCSVCSRDLTDPESIERGIGPICLEKF